MLADRSMSLLSTEIGLSYYYRLALVTFLRYNDLINELKKNEFIFSMDSRRVRVLEDGKNV